MIDRYKMALIHNPDNENRMYIYTQIAKKHLSNGDYIEAIHYFDAAFNCGSIEAAISIAKIMEHRIKDNAAALSWTEKAISRTPNTPPGNVDALEHRRKRLKIKLKHQDVT